MITPENDADITDNPLDLSLDDPNSDGTEQFLLDLSGVLFLKRYLEF